GDQRTNVIGKILEHLSSPEELFKYYPHRPEMMLKGGNCGQNDAGFHVQFSCGKDDSDRNNMSSPVPDEASMPDVSTNIPQQNTDSSSQKWNPKKFKEKMKAKFQSKKSKKYENFGDSKKESNFNKSKCSVEGIKERGNHCFENVKSCLETKVLGQ
ncbi:Hypothetical predicted protein, partial [Paramuricea clavata]